MTCPECHRFRDISLGFLWEISQQAGYAEWSIGRQAGCGCAFEKFRNAGPLRSSRPRFETEVEGECRCTGMPYQAHANNGQSFDPESLKLKQD